MNAKTEQVLNSALALSDEERGELVEALIASLSDTAGPIDESWRAIIERRSAEIRSGKVTPVPWEDVKRRARERLGG